MLVERSEDEFLMFCVMLCMSMRFVVAIQHCCCHDLG